MELKQSEAKNSGTKNSENGIRNLSGLMALMIGMSLTACGSQTTGSSAQPLNTTASSQSGVEYHPSKIIGINPLVPIRADGSNLEAGLRSYIDAFGLVAIGDSGSCSGTHLGNGYVLTAGHCFLEDSPATTAANQACPTIKVYWGYRGSPATGSPKPMVTLTSQCTRLVYAELTNDRDFAIFQVDQMPKVAVGVALESGRTPQNTKITIFGYPMGRPLEWSQYCAVTRSSVAGPMFNAASRLAYQCDTQPGNSGSSVMAINANGVAKVVAVHDAAAPDPIRYNIGTYMYDIRATLLQRGINLDKLTNSTVMR
ncbi:MAG: hypothetical protein EBX52_00920 [Proteobacteria bacterium]|nr:hypothetical protein [Pseudomonadota bacterium]